MLQTGFHVLNASSAPSVDVAVSGFYRTFDEIRAGGDNEFGYGFDGKDFSSHLLSLIINKTIKFLEESASFGTNMPHPFRATAGNRMVYSVPLILFQDDVSGNVSKQWNKHYVVYASNANLPREVLEKEFCVRFVTSSPHVSPMELMRGVKESIL